MRFLRAGLLVALALAVAGCGSKKQAGSVPAGAGFAPASAPAYIVLATDPTGAQWKAADRLLSKFPGREKLLASFRKEIRKDGLDWQLDVKPALPEETHVVWVDFANNGDDVVGYAKPKDEAKFNKLLEAGNPGQVHKKIDGWTVFADKQLALDLFEKARAAGGSLSDVKEFRDAITKLPQSAAARGWVSGKAVQAEIDRRASQNPAAGSFKNFSKSFGTLESLSFSATPEDNGVKVEAAYKTTTDVKVGSFSPELDSALPAGGLLYASFGNLEDYLNQVLTSAETSFPDFERQRTQLEQALGFSFKNDLFPLFSREGAVAVFQGAPVPKVLFALRVPDETKARKVVDRLAALAALSGGDSRTITVHGVQTKQISIASANLGVFVTVTAGHALVTNSRPVLDLALGDSKKLADDSGYQDSRSASGAPDNTVGSVYVNLRAGLPYLFDFAGSSQPDSITPDVRANTKPLQSVFFFGEKDGDRISLSGFLTIQ